MKQWEELKVIIGPELYAEVYRRLAGQVIYFTRRPKYGTSLIVKEIIGGELLTNLAGHFGSSQIYIPKQCADMSAERARLIVADYDAGMKVKDIVNKHRISIRWADECINTARRDRGETLDAATALKLRGQAHRDAIRAEAAAGASFAHLAGKYAHTLTHIKNVCVGIPDSGATIAQEAAERVRREVIEAHRSGNHPGKLADMFNMKLGSIANILNAESQTGNESKGYGAKTGNQPQPTEAHRGNHG